MTIAKDRTRAAEHTEALFPGLTRGDGDGFVERLERDAVVELPEKRLDGGDTVRAEMRDRVPRILGMQAAVTPQRITAAGWPPCAPTTAPGR